MEPRSVSLPPPPPLDDELIQALLEMPEGPSLDCKRLGRLDRVLETVVAFASAEGGIIALGLDDPEKTKGRDRVFGIEENPAALDELRRLVRSRITPEVEGLSFTLIGCTLRDGSRGTVCLLRVPKSPSVHSIVSGGTYRRLSRANAQLSAREINELSFARGGISAGLGLN